MSRWTCRLAVILGATLMAAAAHAQTAHPGHQPPATNQSPAKPDVSAPADDHSAHAGHTTPQPGAPREPIPPLTDADRVAAFPSGLNGHATHERRLTTFVLFDQLEWQGGRDGGFLLDNTSWVGGDINRLWVRAEGESADGRVTSAQAHALYGRSIARWWDIVAGVRQDMRPGPARTWAAFGVQGLAPYWFEVEATGYVGAGGRTHARVEVEYELLFTNRVILQPLVEIELYGKSDPARRLGAGLSTIDTGLRLRYELRREVAPYVGIAWHRAFFGTADFARADGHAVGKARAVFGLRTWF